MTGAANLLAAFRIGQKGANQKKIIKKSKKKKKEREREREREREGRGKRNWSFHASARILKADNPRALISYFTNFILAPSMERKNSFESIGMNSHRDERRITAEIE